MLVIVGYHAIIYEYQCCYYVNLSEEGLEWFIYSDSDFKCADVSISNEQNCSRFSNRATRLVCDALF